MLAGMVQELLGHFTYLAELALLLGAGLGAPFPEDITLLTAGFLAREGVVRLLPAMAVGYGGVLVGDMLVFRLGRRLGPGILGHKRLSRLFTPERRAWIESHFSRHGMLTV